MIGPFIKKVPQELMQDSVPNVIAQIGYGYGLSGERKKAARRQWRINFIASFVVTIVAMIAVLIGSILHVSGNKLIFIFYAPGFIGAIVIGLYAFRRRESGIQLYFKERKAIRDSRTSNLQELNDFIRSAKSNNGHKDGN